MPANPDIAAGRAASSPYGIELAASSERPVYQRIADALQQRIQSGELTGGERLLPIRELARRLAVNRDTVALAYESLATAGWIESTVGRGTFVRPRHPKPTAVPRPALSLSEPVERLLDFEHARPRYAQGDDVVPLHSLVPDARLYPVRDIRRCLDRVIAESGAELFLYGGPQGHAGLRDALAARFAKAAISVVGDDLVLCHGASQGISLAVRLFAAPGDAVAVEAPTYHNVLGTLIGLGVEAVPVPMTDTGPDLEALERVLAEPRVKAFYTIPSFHNPLGITTGAAARLALLEVAARHGVPILEDAFEMDLRYRGRQVPPLAALDDSGLVVHLFSFSKSLFPGLRIGSLAVRDARAIEGLLALKHATDLSDATPLQAALEALLRSGAYDRHLSRMRIELAQRCNALQEALVQHMPEGTRWTEPEGGYQTWVELPYEIDTRDLLPDAAREGVLFAPGSLFLPDRRPSRGLRLTVAQADAAATRQGVEALGRALRRRSPQSRPRKQAVHL